MKTVKTSVGSEQDEKDEKVEARAKVLRVMKGVRV